MNNTQRKIFHIVLLAAFIFFGCGFFGVFLSKYRTTKNLTYILETYADDMNGECPIPIGNDFVIEKVYFTREKTIVYEYHIPKYSKDVLDLQKLKDTMSEIILMDLGAKSLVKLQNNDVIFEYRYFDNQNEEILRLSALFNTPIIFIPSR
jgi:hypothetical protein